MKRFLGIVGVLGVMVFGIGSLAYGVGSVTVYNSGGGFVGSYTTIQAGVNACSTGGTVSASAGTYNEVVYVNKGIALVGAGSNSTTITASGLGETNTVTFDGDATNNASISGFNITGATGSWPNGGMGIYCGTASPSITNNTITGNSYGISCDSSSPAIINNTITGNSCGIYCYYSSPSITNNTISGNSTGIYCYSYLWYSSPSITNNTISGNSGYGIYCYYSSSPSITNNTISRNGTGISCDSSSPAITNNTISGNSYHGIYCKYSSSPSILSITNNIITSNGTASTSYYGIYNHYGTQIIDYNCVWNNGSNGHNNYYSCYARPNDISANPRFIGAGDYHLVSISLCIDRGSNTAPGIPDKDKDGNPRIANGTVDIGAYEFQGIPTPQYGSITVYNTLNILIGSYTTIQEGITACPVGGTVSVSAGTYPEVVYINKGIDLVGQGTPTIDPPFSGDGVAIGDDNASISGFKITGASNGIYCKNYVDSTITNNTITGNSNYGIYCSFRSAPFITNNTISGNSYGIYCSSYLWWCSPSITNNTISGNSYHGIYCSYSFPTITNNILTGNSRGIYCSYSSPYITNNTISGNTNYGIYCSYSSPYITNNIISGNSNYGIYEYDTTSDPRTNYNCFYNNTSGDYFDEGSTPRTVDWLNTIYTGNISANPQFIGGSDFHLQSSSLCIDKGSNAAPAIPAKDKDGKPRIVNGNNDGTVTVDIGAYEFQGSQTGSLSNIRIENYVGSETGTVIITTDGTLTLYLRGYDGSGTLIGDILGTWTVSSGIGAINPVYGTSTIFNPTTVGIGTITAVCGNLTDGTGLITVTHGSATSLTIAPATSTLTADGSQTYTGTARDLDGNTWTVTATFTEDDTIGTMIANIYYPGQVGTWTITATYTTFIATATAYVTYGSATSLTITPATSTLTCDDTQSYTATARDSDGNTWTVTATFSENDPQGTMTANIYYPGRVGTWTIIGTTTNGIVGTATVIVTSGAFINLKIVSLPATTTTYATFTITVSLSDSDGNPYTGQVAMTNTIQSITPTTITIISGTGTAQTTITKSPEGGTDTITVTYGTITAKRDIRVFIDKQQGGTAIGKGATIEFLGTVSTNVTVHIATSTSISQPLPGAIVLAGTVYNIDLFDEQGNRVGTRAGQMGTVTVRLSYPDVNDDGWVDNTNIREENLSIYHLENGIWKALPTTVNGTENFAWAYVQHFSTFTLAGTSTGSISVTSYPSGVRIYLDGSDTTKTTPETLTDISTGSHTIKLTLAGYEDWTGSVTVTARETASISATLKPIILSITHNATTTLGIGKVLTVTMQGQAGGKATFTVSGIATTTMTETSAGTYTGSYTVKAGDNIINGTVTVYLVIGTTTYTKSATQTVTFDTTLTSVFAPNNDNVKVYPNPYKKNDPRFSNNEGRVYFKDISQDAVIRIYTIAGELVEDIKATETRPSWDVRNIASGVYIYTVTGGGGGKSVGKIGIMK